MCSAWSGQDVGKSCVIVTIGGKNIMSDCAISCVIVTNFHLDHIAALPYFTGICGYEGPIYMTYPAKALALSIAAQIQRCMKRVTTVDLKPTVRVDSDIEIQAYYAGHVLGAAMFYVKDLELYNSKINVCHDRS
ncbi:hypothetical protein R1flu_026670 [Riccia fluitans]|uniref:Uncharacterized protein n=1 Tax=Riccia fluitans TaxID=41844 RepID=A0ABD1XGL4_9MARC